MYREHLIIKSSDVLQGLNMYDVRRSCNKDKDKDGPVCGCGRPISCCADIFAQLCYKEMGWMETYLNQPEVKQRQYNPFNLHVRQLTADARTRRPFHRDFPVMQHADQPELVRCRDHTTDTID